MDAYAAETVLIAASEVDERLLECLANYRATFVRTFEDAQRALREHLFRLIVIDFSFDRIRMFDLLRHVRSLARFEGVPVLCIHGADGSASITAALDRVVRAQGGKAFVDLRGNDRSLSGACERLGTIVGGELGIDVEPPHRRLCILIVDHDVDSAHRLGELLEQLGHDVDLAYDGTAGLDAARRLHPDAVFVDLEQRPGDGYRLARRLQRECSGNSVLLLALTSAMGDEECRRMREAGFDGHLLKSAADRQSILSLLSRRASRPASGTNAGRR